MIINHNIAALNTHRQMGQAQSAQMDSMEKLSSGLRINSAKDDAAGLTISEKMRGQIRGLEQGSRNAQDGISMIQTAEGALSETQDILQRMRELAVQSANDTNTGDDRKEINKEIEQLKSEINRISETTEFNGQKVLNGSMGAKATSNDETIVDVVSASGLKAGSYDVDVTQGATVKTAGDGSFQFDGATPGVQALDFQINGVSIRFSDLADNAGITEVIGRINEYSDRTGVTASAGTNDTVSLATAGFGSDAKLEVTGTNAAAIADTATIAGGDDAQVSITDDAGVTTALTGKGQEVVFGGAELTVAGGDATSTTFNVLSSGASLQVGANKDQSILIDVSEMSTNTLGGNGELVKDVDLRTATGANDAIKVLDDAIKQVSGERSKLGAFQNRLEHTINNLNTSSENITAAESRIRDVDYAEAA